MIKVSVIVPCYNVEKSIHKCIGSLLDQTLKEIELIFVDDASQDKTSQILKDYENKYPHIRVLTHDVNQGIGKTRNDGIKEAKGEFIAFVDSDDYVDKHMYEDYYAYAIETKSDFVYANVMQGDKGHVFKEIEIPTFYNTSIELNKKLIFELNYEAWNKIVKRSLIEEHDIRFSENLKYEDVPFMINSVIHATCINHMKGAYYYYMYNGESETNTHDRRTFDIFGILEEVRRLTKDFDLSEEVDFMHIEMITMYMLKQRYQPNKEIRHDFINKAYKELQKLPNWKKNKYYLETSRAKRVIKNHKLLMRIYCFLYLKAHR